MKAHIAFECASPIVSLRPKTQAQRRPALLRNQPFTSAPQQRRQRSHSRCSSTSNGSSPPSKDTTPPNVSVTVRSSEIAEVETAPQSSGVRLVGTFDGGDGDDEMSDLDARIMRGEYSQDEGSTADRLTRPLRKALVKNPVAGTDPPVVAIHQTQSSTRFCLLMLQT